MKECNEPASSEMAAVPKAPYVDQLTDASLFDAGAAIKVIRGGPAEMGNRGRRARDLVGGGAATRTRRVAARVASMAVGASVLRRRARLARRAVLAVLAAPRAMR